MLLKRIVDFNGNPRILSGYTAHKTYIDPGVVASVL